MEECSKFIREDYEKEQNIKIKELEEEENRNKRVKELQRKRREKNEKEKKINERISKKEKKPIRSHGIGGPTNAPAVGPKRNLPDYYGKGGSSNPSGVAGRTRAKKKDEVSSKYYNPKARPKRAAAQEEIKEVSKRTKPTTNYKKTKVSEAGSNFKPIPVDSDMPESNIMEEIPAELLNQIYSEDLDSQDIANIQDKEYNSAQPKPMLPQSNVTQRLMDDNMDVDIPPPYHRSRKSISPPVDMPSANPRGERPNEADEDLIQKAIAESLQDNNLRKFPMSKYLLIRI